MPARQSTFARPTRRAVLAYDVGELRISGRPAVPAETPDLVAAGYATSEPLTARVRRRRSARRPPGLGSPADRRVDLRRNGLRPSADSPVAPGGASRFCGCLDLALGWLALAKLSAALALCVDFGADEQNEG
jgi:hypothetical protein